MRTIKGAARRQAKRRLFKKAKGFVGGRNRLYRTVKETLARSGAYATRDRRDRKRSFRQLWIIRLGAAAKMHGLRYNQLIQGLGLANIALDRKTLSNMAATDPEAFTQVIEKVKQVLPAAPAHAAAG